MPQQEPGSQWDDISKWWRRRRNEMKNEDNGHRTSHSSTFLHTTDHRPFFYDIFYSIAVARIFSTTYAEREECLVVILSSSTSSSSSSAASISSVQFSQRTVTDSPPSTFGGLIQRIHSKNDDNGGRCELDNVVRRWWHETGSCCSAQPAGSASPPLGKNHLNLYFPPPSIAMWRSWWTSHLTAENEGELAIGEGGGGGGGMNLWPESRKQECLVFKRTYFLRLLLLLHLLLLVTFSTDLLLLPVKMCKIIVFRRGESTAFII